MTATDYQNAAQAFLDATGQPPIQRASATFRWTGSWLTVLLAVDPKGVEGLDTALRSALVQFMNGRRLAEIARDHRPELPILFVTGYAENAAIRADFLGTNMGMIAKPFAIDSLSTKIGEMMG